MSQPATETFETVIRESLVGGRSVLPMPPAMPLAARLMRLTRSRREREATMFLNAAHGRLSIEASARRRGATYRVSDLGDEGGVHVLVPKAALDRVAARLRLAVSEVESERGRAGITLSAYEVLAAKRILREGYGAREFGEEPSQKFFDVAEDALREALLRVCATKGRYFPEYLRNTPAEQLLGDLKAAAARAPAEGLVFNLMQVVGQLAAHARDSLVAGIVKKATEPVG